MLTATSKYYLHTNFICGKFAKKANEWEINISKPRQKWKHDSTIIETDT